MLTCAGLSLYHLHLDTLHLIGDRAGMALALACALLALMTAAGLLMAWIARENLTPYLRMRSRTSPRFKR